MFCYFLSLCYKHWGQQDVPFCFHCPSSTNAEHCGWLPIGPTVALCQCPALTNSWGTTSNGPGAYPTGYSTPTLSCTSESHRHPILCPALRPTYASTATNTAATTHDVHAPAPSASWSGNGRRKVFGEWSVLRSLEKLARTRCCCPINIFSHYRESKPD